MSAIEEIMQTARQEVARQLVEAELKEAEERSKKDAVNLAINTEALKLIDPALQQFSHVDFNSFGKPTLRIEIPGFAVISTWIGVTFVTNYGIAGYAEKVDSVVLSDRGWDVSIWVADSDCDGGIDLRMVGMCMPLAEALVRAEEAGDTKEKAFSDFRKWLDKEEEKAVEKASALAKEKTADWCPLLNCACKEKACAWWLMTTEACSVFVLAAANSPLSEK